MISKEKGMKKLSILVLSLLLVACAFSLAGCGHKHTFVDYVSNGDNTHNAICANDNTHTKTENCSGGYATCTEKATCEKCNEPYGDYRHLFADTWTVTDTHHYYESICEGECNEKKDYGEHSLGDDGWCTICNESVEPTEGVIYDVSSDGTYAVVVGYTGTATRVRIAGTYNNLPVTSIYENAFIKALQTNAFRICWHFFPGLV